MSQDKSGFTVWFTGLPCAGKTTIADAIAKELKAKGHKVERLDGDIVRQRLTNDLGFSKEDRDMNLDRVTFVSRLLSRNGVTVLASFASPYRDRRHKTREDIEQDSVFVEVFVKCPLEICIKRDVKGMYAKALAGEIKGFTGVDDPYEEPLDPEIVVETDKKTVQESVDKVMQGLGRLNLL